MLSKIKIIAKKTGKIFIYTIVLIILTVLVFAVGYFQISKKKYISLLNQYQTYKYVHDFKCPEFEYVEPTHPLLDSLKVKYKLDSVAGNGPEINQIVNLMKWAHNIVRHSTFDPIDPGKRNALNIINVATREKRGVNCRMVGTVLNEAYLSLGIKSRLITCTPYADDYKENHSLVMVYSNSLQKWLYMDPTWEAYFMDSDSIILGPLEIRQRIASQKPLLVSGNINYNGQKYMTKSMYKWYMSKNLFRFYCTELSEPGYETKEGIKTFVHLYPTNYHTEKIGKSDTTKNVYIDIYTNDKNYFLKNPNK
ncbi:MAG: hypothetical protein B6I20_06955 [Bacteroidetes bacterium 4572_117]|nr:MAG: hypothetical protein B6I20_06955 [Bacteroidetes bacterium 4572_117]